MADASLYFYREGSRAFEARFFDFGDHFLRKVQISVIVLVIAKNLEIVVG